MSNTEKVGIGIEVSSGTLVDDGHPDTTATTTTTTRGHRSRDDDTATTTDGATATNTISNKRQKTSHNDSDSSGNNKTSPTNGQHQQQRHQQSVDISPTRVGRSSTQPLLPPPPQQQREESPIYYEITVPVDATDGLMFEVTKDKCIINNNNTTTTTSWTGYWLFDKYRRHSNGTRSVLERDNGFRNVGDRILQIDGHRLRHQSTGQVTDLIERSCRNNKNTGVVIIKVQERPSKNGWHSIGTNGKVLPTAVIGLTDDADDGGAGAVGSAAGVATPKKKVADSYTDIDDNHHHHHHHRHHEDAASPATEDASPFTATTTSGTNARNATATASAVVDNQMTATQSGSNDHESPAVASNKETASTLAGSDVDQDKYPTACVDGTTTTTTPRTPTTRRAATSKTTAVVTPIADSSRGKSSATSGGDGAAFLTTTAPAVVSKTSTAVTPTTTPTATSPHQGDDGRETNAIDQYNGSEHIASTDGTNNDNGTFQEGIANGDDDKNQHGNNYIQKGKGSSSNNKASIQEKGKEMDEGKNEDVRAAARDGDIPNTYVIHVPIVESNALMIRISEKVNEQGTVHCTFGGYTRHRDGTKGPAEQRRLFRNIGDRIVAVDGMPTKNSTFKQVRNLIRSLCSRANGIKGFITVEVQDCCPKSIPNATRTNSTNNTTPAATPNGDEVDLVTSNDPNTLCGRNVIGSRRYHGGRRVWVRNTSIVPSKDRKHIFNQIRVLIGKDMRINGGPSNKVRWARCTIPNCPRSIRIGYDDTTETYFVEDGVMDGSREIKHDHSAIQSNSPCIDYVGSQVVTNTRFTSTRTAPTAVTTNVGTNNTIGKENGRDESSNATPSSDGTLVNKDKTTDNETFTERFDNTGRPMEIDDFQNEMDPSPAMDVSARCDDDPSSDKSAGDSVDNENDAPAYEPEDDDFGNEMDSSPAMDIPTRSDDGDAPSDEAAGGNVDEEAKEAPDTTKAFDIKELLYKVGSVGDKFNRKEKIAALENIVLRCVSGHEARLDDDVEETASTHGTSLDNYDVAIEFIDYGGIRIVLDHLRSNYNDSDSVVLCLKVLDHATNYSRLGDLGVQAIVTLLRNDGISVWKRALEYHLEASTAVVVENLWTAMKGLTALIAGLDGDRLLTQEQEIVIVDAAVLSCHLPSAPAGVNDDSTSAEAGASRKEIFNHILAAIRNVSNSQKGEGDKEEKSRYIFDLFMKRMLSAWLEAFQQDKERCSVATDSNQTEADGFLSNGSVVRFMIQNLHCPRVLKEGHARLSMEYCLVILERFKDTINLQATAINTIHLLCQSVENKEAILGLGVCSTLAKLVESNNGWSDEMKKMAKRIILDLL
jgi:hypothetical protein